MKKQDFNQRITLIISSELETWKVLNTTSHLSAYFGNLLGENFGTGLYFTTEDGVHFPRNSQYPIVILKADPKELKEFAQTLHSQEEVKKMFFINEMIETTHDEKIEALVSLQTESEIHYLGVGIFGDNKVIKKLTSQFKLWS